MNSRRKSPSRDGGVDTYPADAHDLASYSEAEAGLAEMRIPLLLRSGDPHERLYIAALDGTGNSMYDDKPGNWSVAARIHDQVNALNDKGIANISGGYVEGVYTQNGLLKLPSKMLDGRYAHTADERVETAYFQLCEQARVWREEDPQAKIRVAGVGFSRGAEEVSMLLRMVEERGIRDPTGARVVRDKEDLITGIQYANRPPLVPPGQTLQAAMLFDPVSTGMEEHDRRLPGSSMSTFGLIAEDERRNLFPASDQIPLGFSEDKRNYSVIVGGSHSDLGGTYLRNGLGTLSFNLGVSFLNRLSDQDFLQKQPVPTDPAQFVVHRSDQHMMGLYGTRNYDRDGLRDHVNQLAPASMCADRAAQDCQRKEPINPLLEQQIERRTAPTTAPAAPAVEKSGLDELFERLYQGAFNRDDRAMGAATAGYLQSADARPFQAEVARQQERMDAHDRQLAAQALEAQQAEASQQQHRSMRR
ncbi:phospholipase effector Tle1 domain-containing protein [Pseudoxanthomonas dokdonensis]|uniref:phospholipase effector Tle1 domain-containing protein n=1 Tax=Pseudoxanthomonas dokdonensis TaxID=344882 RepID=UPI0009F817BB|nr:DUF2235 domain-containing protein [Pseudoxanthomonas dokdonensis]